MKACIKESYVECIKAIDSGILDGKLMDLETRLAVAEFVIAYENARGIK